MSPLSRSVLTLLAILAPHALTSQSVVGPALPSGPATPDTQPSHKQISPRRYWTQLALGFTTSILAHEAGHIIASYAVGANPRFGFDKGRPTVYSGVDVNDRRKQFIFSSAGLNVQTLLDEAILDIPHHKGAAFERGILAGGLATAYFYATIGRNASNSDITYIARTSSLSKTQASLIYAGLATIHLVRIAHDDHYANFFLRPSTTKNGLNLGVSIVPKNPTPDHPASAPIRANATTPQ